jgi:uncharacterized membrane protein YcaP (DUF421 family)
VPALASVLRALFGYFFLVFIVRIVGRRPGRQLTPFEFVLIFFLGGMMLTAVVAGDASLTNALCQITAIGLAHTLLVWLRMRSAKAGSILDGPPLLLLHNGMWHRRTMAQKSVSAEDVMARAREHGIKSLAEIGVAVLERNGDISIIPAKK